MLHHLYNTTTGHIAKSMVLSLSDVKDRNRELIQAGSRYKWISDVARDYLQSEF